ncbi:PLC-like phosphodiesterase [Aspergillus californicus]
MSFSTSHPPPTCLSNSSPASELSSSAYDDSDLEVNDTRSQTVESKSSTFWGNREEPIYDLELDEALGRQRRKRDSIWTRGIAAVWPLFASSGKDKEKDSSLPLLPFYRRNSRHPRRWLQKLTRSCCLLYCVVGILAMFGVIQFITLSCGLIISFFPDEIDRATERWQQPQGLPPSDTKTWATDISRDIIPVPCHSHNDYWRRVPLYAALEAGCIGVEADVWLFDEELLVGHSISSLTPSRTLRSMYIDPLMRILRRQNPMTHLHPTLDQPRNGIFDTDPSQSLVLLVDFKTDGEKTWDYVSAQLSPLRENGYLTHYNGTGIVNGPITVVGTGNAPFNRVTANSTYRDIFFDAPLDRLVDNVARIDTNAHIKGRKDNAGQGLSGISDADIDPYSFNTTNSYYASVSFKKAVGVPWMFHLTERQVQTIRSQIRAAHNQGLKVRYWGTPSWPRNLRNHVWGVLVREGVDMLNVDDLISATRKDWTPRISDWWY